MWFDKPIPLSPPTNFKKISLLAVQPGQGSSCMVWCLCHLMKFKAPNLFIVSNVHHGHACNSPWLKSARVTFQEIPSIVDSALALDRSGSEKMDQPS